ncbi:MAG: GNAT family N-acetyltransferase [Rhodospirillaceae bacterium]|nr:GNAT family N-acetyltransferase [Rhodospirillaceae bacterium]
MLNIILAVREEYGLGKRLSAVLDPSDLNLIENYQTENSVYFVALAAERVIGGAGISPLTGVNEFICELQRMYLRPEFRGQGIGRDLLERCIGSANAFGYRGCYVETIHEMTDAIVLYGTRGFRRLDGPLGRTEHPHNDYWMYLDLRD